MSNDVIEKILELATQDLRMRLEEAFEAGGAKMRRDLLTALKRDDVAFDVALRGLSDSKVGQDKFSDRAPLGTVRPTIQRLIARYNHGISASEIIKHTGFKVNSVRSTLATLRREGLAERHGDLWVQPSGTPDALEPERREALQPSERSNFPKERDAVPVATSIWPARGGESGDALSHGRNPQTDLRAR